MIERHDDPRAFLVSLDGAPVTVDQWQLEKLALVAMRAEILYCVPGLAPELRAKLWGRAFAEPQRAADALLAGLPSGAEVAIIPEGPYVLAKVAGAL